MREIMMQNTVDEKAALANHDKISAIKAEISKMKLQNKLAMRKILTADQLEKWQGLQGRGGQRDDCCQGRGNRFDGKMGPMHGQPMGPGFGPGRGSQMGPE